jgi:ABC-2 type transport system permease protein
MRLPLFRAALKDQQTSMWIYVGVMFFYGLLIMMAYQSVGEMFSDPLSRAEGIVLTKIDTDPDGNDVFNLQWETKAGTAAHIALGFDLKTDLKNLSLEDIEGLNISMYRDLNDQIVSDFNDYLRENPDTWALLNESIGKGISYPTPQPIPGNASGIEMVYFGEGIYVNFTNSGSSVFFMVGLIPSDWNLSNITMLGPVSSIDLTQESDFDKYLKDNPMMKAFFGEEMISYTELDGFIALEYFSMWPLMLLIFIAIKAGSSVSKHVDDQSMDILLATGYSRHRFLNEKMLFVLVNLILVVLSAWIGIILGVVMLGKPVPMAGITASFIGSIPLAIGMIGLSLLLSVIIDEQNKTTGAIMGLTIFMFMIQIVSNIAGWQDGLGYISLFTYYDMYELMIDRAFDPVNMLIPSFIGIVTIIASYIIFQKKDIHA